MSRADNTARHDATTHRARGAIDELDRAGQPVSVAGVAAVAGVSRSWLYDQPKLTAAVTRLRDREQAATAVAAQRATPDSLRQRLESARVEIERLRTENSTLRDQLARALGEQRTRR